MQTKLLKPFVLAVLAALAVALSPSAFAQGVVSSGITGSLIDSGGKPVAGATVTIVHTPTNTTYTAVTSASGRFKVTGLRVGGPYSVSANAGTQNVQPLQDVQTTLGEDTDVQLVARDEVVQLEKFVVAGDINALDANATGSSSVLDTRRIGLQPTSNRSFADLIKTNPFVSMRTFPQVTAVGMNNRYNSITLDGARLNDQFGLAGSGLVSLKNPFSLDAIEQFNVSITPYDVTQSGSAGASINVVSKSGTNEFSGSAYYIYTSDQWQGKDLSGANIGKRPSSSIERTWGATLGGPIIPDHLFFFASYEKYDNPSGSPSNPGFIPDPAFLTFIDAQIKALPGSPDLGSFGGAGANLETDTKRLLKLDWNVTKDHRLTVRYSDTEGSRPNFGSFSTTGFSGTALTGISNTGYSNGITSLSSSYYQLTILEKVWASQLFSTWSPNLKTAFNFSKNDTSTLRTVPAVFPEIRILNVPGTSATTGAPISTLNAFSFGTEISSQGNSNVVNGITYSGNADYTWRDFTFRAGFDREETDFNNLFRAGSYGVFAYDYSPTLNLATATPRAFFRAVAQTGFQSADISRFEQTGYFAQATWEPSQRLNVIFGLRYDVLGSPIVPPTNAGFATAFNSFYPGIRNDGTIDGTSSVAPRVSFNYAFDEKRETQLRGGLGIFLGRNPWVWISNSYGNSGFGRYNLTTVPTNLSTYLASSFDPANPVGSGPAQPAGSTQTINLIQPGLKLPTNLRGNLAIDRKLAGIGATFTVEYIYNKQVEALMTENLNLRVLNGDANNNPTAASYGADGRLRFATNGAGNGGSGNAPLVTGYSNVLRLRNVEAGESHYVALSLDRPFQNNWAYNVTYTRGRATEFQPSGSSTAGSNWGFQQVFNQGAIEVSRSDYEVRDRIQGSLSREFNYFGRNKTTVTLYYEGRTGQPFSYAYGSVSGSSNDLNKDGNGGNDLVAVPTGPSDARFDFSGMTSAQQSAYFDFIKSSGLGKYAGSYAPRNAFTGPWQSRLDLGIRQELRAYGRVRLEVFADFINFGSWLNDDLFNYVETINTNTSNTNQNRVLGGATYTAAGLIRPVVALNPDGSINFPSTSQILPNNADSRWRIQGGVRLKF